MLTKEAVLPFSHISRLPGSFPLSPVPYLLQAGEKAKRAYDNAATGHCIAGVGCVSTAAEVNVVSGTPH
jgi:hypothetical protein